MFLAQTPIQRKYSIRSSLPSLVSRDIRKQVGICLLEPWIDMMGQRGSSAQRAMVKSKSVRQGLWREAGAKASRVSPLLLQGNHVAGIFFLISSLEFRLPIQPSRMLEEIGVLLEIKHTNINPILLHVFLKTN